MMWQVDASLLLLLLNAIAMTALIFQKRRLKVVLQRDNRTIHWEDALRRIRTGHGAIVANDTSGPGRLWWINDPEVIDRPDDVEKCGLRVIDAPSRSTIEQTVSDQGLPERYLRLHPGNFVD